MDMAFLHRAERMLAQGQPARIDHSILVATLAAQRAHGRIEPERRPLPPDSLGADEPLVELLLGGPARQKALSAQQGCFSRAEAGRHINVP